MNVIHSEVENYLEYDGNSFYSWGNFETKKIYDFTTYEMNHELL